MGAFADYAVIPESVTAAVPTTIDFETAAAPPSQASPRFKALRDELHLKPGRRVLTC